jgi:hypothetical protein
LAFIDHASDEVPQSGFDLPFIEQSRNVAVQNKHRIDGDRVAGCNVDVGV